MYIIVTYEGEGDTNHKDSRKGITTIKKRYENRSFNVDLKATMVIRPGILCILKKPKGKNDDVQNISPRYNGKSIVLKPLRGETEVTQEENLSI